MATDFQDTGSMARMDEVSTDQPRAKVGGELERVPLLRKERNTALEAVYDGLSDDIVETCEQARGRIRRTSLVELRKVRDALAPSGRFKEWCLAVGINYGTAKNRLGKGNSKRTDNNKLSGRSLALMFADGEQRADTVAKLREVLEKQRIKRDDWAQAVLFLYQYWWEHEHGGTAPDIGGQAA
jgi:hypothetical protein